MDIDFANTEAKIAQLNYQTPELQLFAKRQIDAPIAPLQETVINAYQLTHLDFDIEGAAVADHASIDRRSQARRH